MNEYQGVIHLHSIFSDGTGEVEDIALTAQEVNLDFLVLTDHNTMRAKSEGFEKFYGKTFLLVGCEINDRENRNHYLALGISQTPSTRLPAHKYVDEVNKAGGIGFLAHPHEKRSSMPEHPPYPWTDWSTDEFTGIEIWNHMSVWMENLTEENKYQSFLHPLRTVAHPPEESLKLWDEISKRRKIVGIGGIDAHAHKIDLLGFFEVEVFPYKVLFKSIRTHILTHEEIVADNSTVGIKKASDAIIESLRNGRCFVSNFSVADARGFCFCAVSDAGEFQQGDVAPLSPDLILKVALPGLSATIRIIGNGEVVSEIEGEKLEYKVTLPGSYRVEIERNGRAWIYSNHIYVSN